ncbi:PilZ domain-containing protein [Pelagibacterium montanilacus]|uniref:PilZ domain-containing protein n=1 Tax=Pelagibacterium montanilacus TaxID=2185280 RepID=UPI0013DEAEA2|nr:PilZ domain-containing protein [Pelagibacterium montanilacus]
MTSPGPAGQDAPAIDDRTRHITDIRGRYFLAKWRGESPTVSSFTCRIRRISPLTMSLSAPVGGTVGDVVITHFDELGVITGTIARNLGFGFVVAIQALHAERTRLAARVTWLEKRRNFQVPERRRHPRVIPRNPESTIILADGSRMRCTVIDMSASGVAVAADILPAMGTPLAVGSAVGRVVRHLDPGFAIAFITPLGRGDLERRLIRPAPEQVYL